MFGQFLEWLIVGVLARAFPSRYRLIPRTVPFADGAPLLRQFRLFSIGKESPRGTPPWWHVSAFLQSFVLPESRDVFHIHRWRYLRSFVLSGGFVEERYPGYLYVPHVAPSTYTMSDDVIHRLAYVEPRTWTLFLMVGKSRQEPAGGWGYFERPKVLYSPWNEAIPESARVKSIS